MEIVKDLNCQVCDEHRTMLGLLSSCVNGVFNETNIKLTDELNVKLAIAMFEQMCLDKRTETIQSFKKINIKEINK